MTRQPHPGAGMGKPDFRARRLQPAVRFTSLNGKTWPRILPKFGPFGPPFGAASFQEDFEGIPHLTAISILDGNKAFIATFNGDGNKGFIAIQCFSGSKAFIATSFLNGNKGFIATFMACGNKGFIAIQNRYGSKVAATRPEETRLQAMEYPESQTLSCATTAMLSSVSIETVPEGKYDEVQQRTATPQKSPQDRFSRAKVEVHSPFIVRPFQHAWKLYARLYSFRESSPRKFQGITTAARYPS